MLIVKITSFIVWLLRIWISAPQWMSLFRKTTQVADSVWQQDRLENTAFFDSSTQLFPGAPANLWEQNTNIFIFCIGLSESQPGTQNHLNSHFFCPSRLFILVSRAFISLLLLIGHFSTIRLQNASEHKMMMIEMDTKPSCWLDWARGLPHNCNPHNYMVRKVSH